MNISGLNTFTFVMVDNLPSLWLHIFRYPYAQSSVLACRLGFDQAGLSSLLAAALLGALQNVHHILQIF